MREMNNTLYQSYSINVIGSIYFDNGDYEHALEYYQQGYVSRHEAGDKWGEAGSLDNIGFTYFKLKDYDQAIHYCDQSLTISRSTDDKRSQANALIHLAEIYSQTNNAKLATRIFK
jgi:tetratricopeptide (TPR) repeat protein